MKWTKTLLLTIALLGITFNGCKKETNSMGESYLVIGDTSFDLKNGILMNLGMVDAEEGIYGLELLLLSDGFTFEFNEDSSDFDVSGKGNGISFTLFSDEMTLTSGTFTFANAYPFEAGTFAYASYVLGYDSEEDDFDEEDDIVSGKVTVTKSGNTYTIKIECTSESGNTVSGTYKGSLEMFDLSEDNSSGNGSGYMIVDEVTYELSQGMLDYYGMMEGTTDGGYNFDITLLSSGVTFDEYGEITSVNGNLDIIYFELFSSRSDDIASGSYMYDPYETYAAGTFDFADGLLNYNIYTDTGTYFEITSGTLYVSKSDGMYEIILSGNTDGISLYYEGELMYYDYSDVDYAPNLAPKTMQTKAKLRRRIK